MPLSGFWQRHDGDLAAEFLQTSDVMAFDVGFIKLVNGLGPRILVRYFIHQDMIDGNHDSVGHGHNGLLFATTCNKTRVLGGEIGFFGP